MGWLDQYRALLRMTPAPQAPGYAANNGGTFVQRGISVVTAPFTPPVLDPGQAGYYNGSWFANPATPPVLDPGQAAYYGGAWFADPNAPVTLDPGQSVFSGGQLTTAPGVGSSVLDAISGLSAQIQAALAALLHPPAPAAPAPAASVASPAPASPPSCNSGNFSCIRYACAPGNFSCARSVAPWFTGGNIW